MRFSGARSPQYTKDYTLISGFVTNIRTLSCIKVATSNSPSADGCLGVPQVLHTTCTSSTHHPPSSTSPAHPSTPQTLPPPATLVAYIAIAIATPTAASFDRTKHKCFSCSTRLFVSLGLGGAERAPPLRRTRQR